MASDHINDVTIFPLQQQQQDLQAVEDDEEEFDNETEYESDEEEDLNSNSSADPSAVTVAVPPPSDQPPIINFIDSSELKRQRIDSSSSSSLIQPQVTHVLPQIAHVVTVAVAAVAAPIATGGHVYDHQPARKQFQQPVDEARKLFQRLWTDEDEIEMLQGFYEYTSQRGINNNNVHHHNDITLFYDQIKSKLQLEFNRNQLVEKLRRLKKKYRNNVVRIGSGKEFVFKIPHDFATFNISRKIWGDSSSVIGCASGGATVNVAATTTGGLCLDGVVDDEDLNHKHGISVTSNNHSSNDMMIFDLNNNNMDKKAFVSLTTHPRSRKRPISSPHVTKVEEKTGIIDEKCIVTPISSSIHGLIEETVKTCLSPLLKEMLSNTKNGDARGSMLGPISLSFGGSSSSIESSLLGGEVVEEKWRKQQILELEVYSQRLDLVQDQIKATLEELRSAGSS